MGDAGAAAEELEDGLTLDAIGFLREVTDRSIRRAEDDRTLDVGGSDSGQCGEKRRLAGAVRADEADDVAGGNGEIEVGEQGAFSPGSREAADAQCCSHLRSIPGAVRLY